MGPAGDLGAVTHAPVLLASWRPARSQAGAQVTSSACSDLDPETLEQASAQQGSGRPQAPSLSEPWGCPPCSPPSRAEMGVPVPAPRTMLRAATGGSPQATPASSWRDLALGPMCRWHVSAGATACLPPGPGGAGHLGSQGGRRSTQPAGCGSGGLHWGAVHSLLAPASRWLLVWGLAPSPRWSPTTKQVLQQHLSAPCPGCGTCSRTCSSAHLTLGSCPSPSPPPSPRLLLQRPPAMPPAPHSPPAPPALADTGLESQLAAFAAASRGPAPQETECWGSGAGAGPGLRAMAVGSGCRAVRDLGTLEQGGQAQGPACRLPSLWMLSPMPAQM